MEKEQSKSSIYNEAANWRLSRLFVPACGQIFDWPIAACIQLPRHNQKDNQETPRELTHLVLPSLVAVYRLYGL